MRIIETTGPGRCYLGCMRSKRNAIIEQIELKHPCNGKVCMFKNEIEQALVDNIKRPEIISFNSSLPYIEENTAVELTWEVENAESLHINKIGDVTGVENIWITPEAPLEFTITASNGFFEASKMITLLPQLPHINHFELDKGVVPSGTFVSLKWEVSNAKQVLLNNENSVSDSDQYEFLVDDIDVNVSLIALGHFETKSIETRTIKVAKIIEFRSEKATEERYQLVWKLKHIERVKILITTGEIIFESDRDENIEDGTIDIPTSMIDVSYEFIGYTSCGDIVSKTIELKAARIDSFISESEIAYNRMPIKFRWETANANKVLLSGAAGEKEHSSSIILTANQNQKEYTLTVYGDINTDSRKVTLKFIEVPKPELVKIKSPIIRLPNLAITLNKKNNFLSKNERIIIYEMMSNISINMVTFKQPNISIPQLEKIQNKGLVSNLIRKTTFNIGAVYRELWDKVSKQLNNSS